MEDDNIQVEDNSLDVNSRSDFENEIEGIIKNQDTDQGQSQVTQPPVDGDYYEKDPRYEKEWGKDPNSIYKALKEKETGFMSLQKEKEDFTKKLSEYEAKIQEKEAAIGNFSQVKQLVDFFESNPKYGEGLVSYLNQIAEEEKKIKYGDLPPEVIEKLEASDRLSKQMEEMQFEKQRQENFKIIEDQLSTISAYAKKKGITYDEMKFLKYLDKEKVLPQYMADRFKSLASDLSEKMAERKASVNTAKTIASNKQKSLAPTQSRATEKPAMTLKDTILQKLGAYQG
jgi:hypothetical protein